MLKSLVRKLNSSEMPRASSLLEDNKFFNFSTKIELIAPDL